ncbi:hypothetical protein MNVI_28410 [Mycobacterium noviomagense]|uniref:Uncharacterized protein n=1 Tax=Mycobacterium noviomagense TaxID=459858 RepID=A0A7I7PFZ2_9MYCO|nr:hypothetical protein MNVI_28410 [Mycobacterium noviomagense]
MQSNGERVRPGSDEVGATVLLHRHDRLPAGTGIAAEREHGHLRVDARAHYVRRIRGYLQLLGACFTPARRRRAAAAAFQREEKIEHA